MKLTIKQNIALKSLYVAVTTLSLECTRDEEFSDLIAGTTWFHTSIDEIAQAIPHIIAEEDETATCSICNNTYHESEVNMIDYSVDICVSCEINKKVTS